MGSGNITIFAVSWQSTAVGPSPEVGRTDWTMENIGPNSQRKSQTPAGLNGWAIQTEWERALPLPRSLAHLKREITEEVGGSPAIG